MNNNLTKILLALAMLTGVLLNAQVRTTIYVNGDAFNYHPQLQNVRSNNISLVNVNPERRSIDSLIQEDNELDARGVGRPARFGHNIKSNISMSQGQWATTLLEAHLDSLGFSILNYFSKKCI